MQFTITNVHRRLQNLHQRLQLEGIPIEGVAKGRIVDGTPVDVIDYLPEATAPQRQKGDAILAGWDWGADPIPEQITRRQARLWLVDKKLLSAVEAKIDQTGAAARVEYETPIWYRSSPLVAQIGAALGKADAEIDQFFREASAIG